MSVSFDEVAFELVGFVCRKADNASIIAKILCQIDVV